MARVPQVVLVCDGRPTSSAAVPNHDPTLADCSQMRLWHSLPILVFPRPEEVPVPYPFADVSGVPVSELDLARRTASGRHGRSSRAGQGHRLPPGGGRCRPPDRRSQRGTRPARPLRTSPSATASPRSVRAPTSPTPPPSSQPPTSPSPSSGASTSGSTTPACSPMHLCSRCRTRCGTASSPSTRAACSSAPGRLLAAWPPTAQAE